MLIELNYGQIAIKFLSFTINQRTPNLCHRQCGQNIYIEFPALIELLAMEIT